MRASSLASTRTCEREHLGGISEGGDREGFEAVRGAPRARATPSHGQAAAPCLPRLAPLGGMASMQLKAR